MQFVAECTERRVIYANLDEFKGCQAGESEDMLYLVQRLQASPEGVEFRTYDLPKAGLKVIVAEPRHFDWQKRIPTADLVNRAPCLSIGFVWGKVAS